MQTLTNRVNNLMRLLASILVMETILLSPGAVIRAESNGVGQNSPQASTTSQPTFDSLVVFFRPKRFGGSALTPSVYVDGQEVARLDNGRYFSLRVSSGKHQITSSMKHSPLEIEAKPGEAVYLEMVILPGNWRGGGRFVPAPAEDALSGTKKLKPLDAKWIFERRVGFDLQLKAESAVDAVRTPGERPTVPTDNLKPVSATATTSNPTDAAMQATLEISSTPAGAAIELDGTFAGNTPSSIGVAAGEHVIRVTKTGYKAWERKIKTSTGVIKVIAEMEASSTSN